MMVVYLIQSKSTKNVIAAYSNYSLAYKMWGGTQYDIVTMEVQ